MALESCDILILSDKDYLAIRKGGLKCSGQSNWGVIPYYWKLIQVKPIDQPLEKDTVDLMPINLVKFNTEMENEE